MTGRGAARIRPWKNDLVFEVDAAVTARVRARIEDAVSQSGPDGAGNAATFWLLFPNFKLAVDALPNLTPLLRVCQEMRALPLDSYALEGVEVPERFWEALGLAGSYKGHRTLAAKHRAT